MERESKDFKDVVVGDDTHDCNCFEFYGKVLAKGKWGELYKDYNCVVGKEEMAEYFDEDEDFESYEAVAVELDGSGLEGYENLIFFYNYDPSSVCVLKQ